MEGELASHWISAHKNFERKKDRHIKELYMLKMACMTFCFPSGFRNWNYAHSTFYLKQLSLTVLPPIVPFEVIISLTLKFCIFAMLCLCTPKHTRNNYRSLITSITPSPLQRSIQTAHFDAKAADSTHSMRVWSLV